ncbi:GNAT family N-acetyltransferase [Dongia deserti]|uniref:GNAT family N-acetyltransferase n=1 Tax=Dongia deserti TaxID=2268030 RepID=UPI000E656E5C|nr:GNAT family N-acetyltransferase [Dongia deserti]
MTDLNIRRSRPDDRDFIFAQATRLASVAELPWHSGEDVLRFQRRFMANTLARPETECATFIAETDSGDRIGFVHVEASTDSVTLEPCGYVSLLAVVETALGQGIARRLMDAAEDWARQQGFRLICLDVFANNQRARAFYARQGYRDDSLRLTKPLSDQKV